VNQFFKKMKLSLSSKLSSKFSIMHKINGTLISNQIKETLKQRIVSFKKTTERIPGLAVILVGNRPDSTTYVRYKEIAAKDIGMNVWVNKFTEDVTQDTIIKCIDECNQDPNVNGIIVQLPLPRHLNSHIICERVHESKDVDGLKLITLAKLATNSSPEFIACTPKGCLALIKSTGITVAGKKVTVVGRSQIVGMPMALLLNLENATVTICHHETPLELTIKELQSSDIVVIAVGHAEMFKGEWFKKGAIVIDVGINSIPDATKKSGYRLVGDVDYKSAENIVSAITPVPGGVGPMTVVMLLENTVDSFEKSINKLT
jgi:methylenetetrahydrofolate dehydrogenase (NADP+)/methenyltetrahydrofolate cyclohydrolase/formyltetrahydrofolate synthetase